jgi:hypothetical protein
LIPWIYAQIIIGLNFAFRVIKSLKYRKRKIPQSIPVTGLAVSATRSLSRSFSRLNGQNGIPAELKRFQSDNIHYSIGNQSDKPVKIMFSALRSPIYITQSAIAALFSALLLSPQASFAKDAVEAAKDLAETNQSDPNGFTLMIVSICMLFVFALTLIIATSIHVFKKPKRRPAAAPTTEPSDESSYTSSAPQR